jgi:hypothetical protein
VHLRAFVLSSVAIRGRPLTGFLAATEVDTVTYSGELGGC